MIMAGGQLEAFEENIFLYFFLMSLKNLRFNEEFCAAFQYRKLERKSLLKLQMDLGNTLIAVSYPHFPTLKPW